MKRILIFSLAYYPHVGGAEVALKELTDRIDDVEFHMLTLNFCRDKAEEKVGNIFVHRIGHGSSYLSKILFIPRAALAARALHQAHSFDALWVMMSYMVLPVVFARLSVPYVLTLQEGDSFSHMFNRLFILPFQPLLRAGFRHAAAVSAISTYLAGWAGRMGYRGEVAIIPNGVDLEVFTRVTHQTITTEGVVNLVTASRLVSKNALDDVIRALVSLPEHVRFVVYGNGPEEQALRSLASSLGVADRVLFKGYLPHRELANAFNTAHIFIRPSRTEGMGNAFIEAMAAGLPVIATQKGGIADFLFDAKRNPDKPTTGWAVDVGAPAQIAQAVKDIMTNPDKVTRVRANALALVREKYGWELISRQMRALFATLSV